MIHYEKLGKNARKALAGFLVAANIVGGLPVYAAETSILDPTQMEKADDVKQTTEDAPAGDTEMENNVSSTDPVENDSDTAEEITNNSVATEDSETGNDVQTDNEDMTDNSVTNNTANDSSISEEDAVKEKDDLPENNSQNTDVTVLDSEETNVNPSGDDVTQDDTALPESSIEQDIDKSAENITIVEKTEENSTEVLEEKDTGWKQTDGNWCYIDEDGLYKNRVEKLTGPDGKTVGFYGFDEYGRMQTGWLALSETVYYFGEDGTALSGVQEVDGATYWFDFDGSIKKNIWYEENEKKYYFDSDGVMCTNVIIFIGDSDNENSAYYRFDKDGCMVTGWYQSASGNQYYYAQDGKAVRGMQEVDGFTYFFDQGGRVRTDYSYETDGKVYYFGSNGRLESQIELSKNGWQKAADGNWHYIESGVMVKNEWRKIQGAEYYFGSNGNMYKNVEASIKDLKTDIYSYYRFDENGHVVTGWYQESSTGSKYYYNKDGKAVQGMMQIGNDTYYFDIKGRSLTDYTCTQDKVLYYFDETGKLVDKIDFNKSGWQKTSDGSWYYFESGKMIKDNWREIQGAKYYFDSDGRMYKDQTVPIKEAGTGAYKNYRFDENGRMVKGWYEDKNGNWFCYDNATGASLNGIQKIGKDTYCFDAYGQMITDEVVTEGRKKYRFDKNGSMVKGWYEDSRGIWYYYDTVTGAALNGMKTIGKDTYCLGSDGQMMTNYSWSEAGRLYYFDITGKLTNTFNMIKNGWKATADGNWYYVESGKMVKNDWRKISNSWYYFDDTGKMCTDTTKEISDPESEECVSYRFDKNGHMVINWYQDSYGDWFFYETNGCAAEGMKKIGKDTYYFGVGGKMETKYSYADESNLYYFGENGKLMETQPILQGKDGWLKNKQGDWFYVKSGELVKEQWIQSGKNKYYIDANGIMCKDMEKNIYDEKLHAYSWYRFNQDGRMITGWHKANGSWYYYNAGGNAATGLQSINKKTYYFNECGEMQVNGKIYLNHILYSYGADGVCTTVLKNGWIDNAYYAENGKAVTGWKKISGKWYYFSEDSGKKVCNTKYKINGKDYIFDSDGTMKTGWVKGSGSGELYWMYADSDGVLVCDSWKKISGKWYFFGRNNKMVTGIQRIEGKLELFRTDGSWSGTSTKDQWYQDSSKNWFYIKNNVIMKSTVQKIGGKYYRFDENGRMLVKQFGENYDFYFGNNGAAVTKQWKMDGEGQWHYYAADGKAVKNGWKKIGSDWYYFENSTILTEDCVLSDGKLYHFSKSGVSNKKGIRITNGWNLVDGQYYYYNKDGSYLTGMQLINGSRYYFQDNGRMAYYTIVGNAENGWYYADKNGRIAAKAWCEIEDTYYYAGTDGKLVTGLQSIGGKRYYFSQEGIMYDMDRVSENDAGILYMINGKGEITKTVNARGTGWKQTDCGNWFYSKNGEFVTGYQKIGGKAYYFYNTGCMAVEAVVEGYGYADAKGQLHENGWYGDDRLIYVRNGRTLDGPETVNGKKYYFSYIADTGLYFADGNYYNYNGSKGSRTTARLSEGWNQVNGLWYYVKNGAVQVGDQEINGKFYHFAEDGVMLNNCLYNNNGRYQYLDDNGFAIKNRWMELSYKDLYRKDSEYVAEKELEIVKRWYFFDANGFAVVGRQKIDGKSYIFSDSGKML